MLALGQMCSEGMGAVQKVGLRCWHWLKFVMRQGGELPRVVEVLALDKMCFAGMGELTRVVEVLALGEMYFQGIGAVAKRNERC